MEINTICEHYEKESKNIGKGIINYWKCSCLCHMIPMFN